MGTKLWALLLAVVAVTTARPAEDVSEALEQPGPRVARAHYGSLKKEHRTTDDSSSSEEQQDDDEPLRYYGGASGFWNPATGTRSEDDSRAPPSDVVAIQPPPEGASMAEARPVGLSIAGIGGVAASRPQATALVGPGGLAVSRPVATAIAGVPVGEAILGPGLGGAPGGGGGGSGDDGSNGSGSGGSGSNRLSKVKVRVSESSPQQLAVGPGVVGSGGKYSVVPAVTRRAQYNAGTVGATYNVVPVDGSQYRGVPGQQPVVFLPVAYYY